MDNMQGNKSSRGKRQASQGVSKLLQQLTRKTKQPETMAESPSKITSTTVKDAQSKLLTKVKECEVKPKSKTVQEVNKSAAVKVSSSSENKCDTDGANDLNAAVENPASPADTLETCISTTSKKSYNFRPKASEDIEAADSQHSSKKQTRSIVKSCNKLPVNHFKKARRIAVIDKDEPCETKKALKNEKTYSDEEYIAQPFIAGQNCREPTLSAVDVVGSSSDFSQDNTKDIYDCFLCSESAMFIRWEDLLEHIRNKHCVKVEESYLCKCTKCHYGFNILNMQDDSFDDLVLSCMSHMVESHGYSRNKHNHQGTGNVTEVIVELTPKPKDEERGKRELEKDKCEKCGNLVTVQYMKKHLAKHCKGCKETYSCRCGKTVLLTGLENHRNACLFLQSQQLCRCSDCGLVFKTVHNLEHHIRRCHLKDYKHACNICNEKFFKRDVLLQHYYTVHGQNISNRKVLSCVVDECPYTAIYAYDMNQHVRRRHMKGPFNCQRCGKKCNTYNTFNKHTCVFRALRGRQVTAHISPQVPKKQNFKISNRTQYKCTLCNYVSVYKKKVETHQKQEHNIEPDIAIAFKVVPLSEGYAISSDGAEIIPASDSNIISEEVIAISEECVTISEDGVVIPDLCVTITDDVTVSDVVTIPEGVTIHSLPQGSTISEEVTYYYAECEGIMNKHMDSHSEHNNQSRGNRIMEPVRSETADITQQDAEAVSLLSHFKTNGSESMESTTSDGVPRVAYSETVSSSIEPNTANIQNEFDFGTPKIMSKVAMTKKRQIVSPTILPKKKVALAKNAPRLFHELTKSPGGKKAAQKSQARLKKARLQEYKIVFDSEDHPAPSGQVILLSEEDAAHLQQTQTID